MSLQEQSRTIFVAGAGGAVGRRLCPLLIADGWRVVGMTRSPEKANGLRAMGVEPVVVDAFEAEALTRAVVAAKPAVVVHQLTDLPPGLDPAQMPEARVRNARLREIGTGNLVSAAAAAGAGRFIAQSIAFAYVLGPLPYTEESPLDPAARGVIRLEAQVLSPPSPMVGIVLRYGKFYGPETGFDAPPPGGPLHINAAADAARRAVTHGAAGVYNIAEEDDGTVSSRKAARELGWDAGFRGTTFS